VQFNYDHPVTVALTKAFDVCAATAYCILCCIPVFTMGASLTALSSTLMAISANEGGGVTGMFFRAFWREFKQATLVWLVMLAAGAVLAADIYICWVWAQPDSLFIQLLRGMTCFFLLLYAFLSVYLYAGIAKFEVSFAQAFHNALVFAFTNLLKTVAQVLLLALMAAVVFFLGIFAFPLVALGAYLQAKLCRRAFLPYLPKDPEEEEAAEDEER